MDAKRKLQEIAAKDLGGSPDDYELGNERVYRRGNPGGGLTYAQAAKRAIALGGKYDGHERARRHQRDDQACGRRCTPASG